MKGSKVALGLLLAALLVSTTACSGETQTRFADGQSEHLVVFPPGGGENSSLSIWLPAGIEVENASLDIEGRRGLNGSSNYTADFVVPQGSTAWSGNLTALPTVLPPANYEELNITLVPSIKRSDDVRSVTAGTNTTPYHMFEMYTDDRNVTEFNLSWEGIGFTHPEIGIGSNGAVLYLWDRSSRNWDLMDAGGFGEVPYEVMLFANVTINPSRYVDTDGHISALVHPTYPLQYWTRVETDCVKLRFAAWQSAFPADVALDVRADGSVEWNHAGPLDRKEVFSGPAFSGALQKAVDNATSENATVPLKLTSSSGGLLFISNLSIVYRPRDLPPCMRKDIPQVVLSEDTPMLGALDLPEYFDDEGGAGNLTFNMTWLENGDKLRAEINGTRLDLFPSMPDWYGAGRARLRATDSKGQWVESNDFTVLITPVNDAPRLERVAELTASEGVPFEHAFNATDPDDANLSFSTNSTLFSVDPATGKARFMPHNNEVGRHLFRIGVEDDEGAGDSMNLSLTVLNRNDPPKLNGIDDVAVYQGKTLNLKLGASDPDLDIGMDRLHFSVNTSMFDISDDGLISFTPLEKDVGVHPIKATVTDAGGLSDTRNFTITVLNVNDPPVLAGLADLTVQEHRAVSFRVNATDPDAGDRLTFRSNTPLFVISKDGWANFTPGQKDVGTWNVHLDVTDIGGLVDSMQFNITVVNVNEPPSDVKILSPVNGRVYAEGGVLPLRISLVGSASDEDGDLLTYQWYVDGDPVAWGQNATIEHAGAGKHTVTLEVSDGILSANSTPVEFTVRKEPAKTGFDLGGLGARILLVPLVVATAIIVVVIIIRRRNLSE